MIFEAALSEFYVGTMPAKMFVQRLSRRPGSTKQPFPIIMIHGGLQTGSGFISTPDGRPGWAPLFTDKGWEVYVVDWPGVGRSGFHYPQSLDIGALDVRDCVLKLLDLTGPAVLVGHSIGGALSFKVAESAPHMLRSVVALAPASMETNNPHVSVASLDAQVTITREEVVRRFANSDRFPSASLDQYMNSMVPYSPKIRNAAAGVNNDLRIDRQKVNVWTELPLLFLTAEMDTTVTAELSEETAKVMGVHLTRLQRDWNLPGYGHAFPSEIGSEIIAARVQQWLEERLN